MESQLRVKLKLMQSRTCHFPLPRITDKHNLDSGTNLEASDT